MINMRTVKEFFIITMGTLIVSTAVFFLEYQLHQQHIAYGTHADA